MLHSKDIFNLEQITKKETAEQSKKILAENTEMKSFSAYAGMEDVFEANENAKYVGRISPEDNPGEQSDTEKTESPENMTAETKTNAADENTDDAFSDASIGSSLKSMQDKLKTAQDNLEHAQKRLKSLLSSNNTPRNLIRDREYQIKVYEKDIEHLQRDINREMSKLD